MSDSVNKVTRTFYPLEELDSFKDGRRLYFDSIAEMFTVRAQEIPDKAHVLYYDQVITYAQTNERSNRVANYLKEMGVKKGDVISVMVLNSPEVYYTMFGAQKLGAIAGGVNYMLKGPEIAHVLDDSKPKVAFVSSEFMKDFAAGYEMASHRPVVVEVYTGIDHGANIAEQKLSDILAKYPADEALIPLTPEDPFLLLYSSGTTGRPKGILLSNRGQLSICREMVTSGLLTSGDTMMIVLPMFHTNPLCVWTYPMAYVGSTLCIRKMFSPQDFWPSILNYGITIIMGVPTMYNYVCNAVDPGSLDKSKLKLKYAFCGAAPLPVELIRAFKEKFEVTVIEGYGLTEATGVSTSSFGVPLKWGSIGIPYPEQQIEIMDDENNILPVGEKGEICIRGDAVMSGYLNKPEATAETVRDGWLHTGDMGYMDEEGYLYVAGRKKEMINRGGENIYPREIEAVLETHPAIDQVAVVGVQDPSLGERVKACIILREQGSLNAEDVKAFLKDKIAKYKIPEFVEFRTSFPLNPTGKILKGELK
ncbi:MAG TPA: long-chain fatty acid--CoA ligase [Desulfotomaculum sp.]|nr:long-chain fatty acid--CoA ligase [Desulfotomaculum sp.]